MNNKAINEFSEGVIHLDLRSVNDTLLDLLILHILRKTNSLIAK